MGRSVGFSITLQQNNPLPKSSHRASNTKLPTPNSSNSQPPQLHQTPNFFKPLTPTKLPTSSNHSNSWLPQISEALQILLRFTKPLSSDFQYRSTCYSKNSHYSSGTCYELSTPQHYPQNALLGTTSCLNQSSTQTQQSDKRHRHTIKSSKHKTRYAASWAQN